MTVLLQVYKVVHTKEYIETVYLVHATSAKAAETQLLDTLYERAHRIRAPLSRAERETDVFGLKTEFSDYTNTALCKHNGCSVSAILFKPDPVYKLYTINRQTGEMT